MKKILFLDRDGTIIIEPPGDYQVDSFEKLSFLPLAISTLTQIAKNLDYDLVMVTNQDGMGTPSFPEDTFWPAHNKMLQILSAENIDFSDILIDCSRPEENAPTRKPQTGLLTKYLSGDYDLTNSYVIGDRPSDLELAENLGCRSILISATSATQLKADYQFQPDFLTNSWPEIYSFLLKAQRQVNLSRKTSETDIVLSLALDGNPTYSISTGIPFFDHMLEQLAKHSGCSLDLNVTGDLQIDEHHTVEDTALALGEAYRKALGNKLGISRYGFCLPMDDCLAQVAIDFSGRPWLVWDAEYRREKVGDLPTEMFYHFFKSFADAAACNINIKAEGQNEHHKIEATFKAFAKAIRMAIAQNKEQMLLPTTKGAL